MCFDATISFSLAMACAGTSIVKLYYQPKQFQHGFGILIACIQLLEFILWLRHDCGDVINIVASYAIGIVLVIHTFYCTWIVCRNNTKQIQFPYCTSNNAIKIFYRQLTRKHIEIVPTPNLLSHSLVGKTNLPSPLSSSNKLKYIPKTTTITTSTCSNILKIIVCISSSLFFTCTFIYLTFSL
jgi:hypothetical protein